MLNKLNDRYPSDVLNTLNLLALEYLHQHQVDVIACCSEEEDGDKLDTQQTNLEVFSWD